MHNGPTFVTPMIQFRREERDGNVALVVVGEIDLSTAESFDDQLQAVVAAAHSPAYVDLSGVSFIDSSGVKALAAASQSATQAGVNLVLVKPSRQVRVVLGITELAQDFDILD